MFELPDWFNELRPWQTLAIAQIAAAFKKNDFVFLDAPTGSGKTLIAECTRQVLRKKAAYICVTKSLQDQFLRDYEYARVLKGRSNYPTENLPFPDVTCDDCTTPGEMLCAFCNNICQYKLARFNAKQSEIGVINLAYAINEFKSGNSAFSKRGFKIIDECDIIENVLLSQASLSISKSMQRKLRLKPPEKKTKEDSWLEWSEHALGKVAERIDILPEKVQEQDEQIKLRRHKKTLRNIFEQLIKLNKDLKETVETGEKSWIYTDYERGNIAFKPLHVDEFGKEYLWQHGGKWLLMSGTIISPAQMAREIGIEAGNFATVTVNYSFERRNRPIVIRTVGSMRRSEIESTTPRMGEQIRQLLADHKEERILIHCHSYQLAERLYAEVLNGSRESQQRPIITYGQAGEREAALQDYLLQQNSVIIAPSLDRGIDLPYDKCGVQIICKTPFPYLGDKVVSAKTFGTKGGQLWYDIQTIRAIVQMSGRGMRHADDRVVTYILDSDFNSVFRKRRNLFPKWWSEAITA